VFVTFIRYTSKNCLIVAALAKYSILQFRLITWLYTVSYNTLNKQCRVGVTGAIETGKFARTLTPHQNELSYSQIVAVGVAPVSLNNFIHRRVSLQFQPIYLSDFCNTLYKWRYEIITRLRRAQGIETRCDIWGAPPPPFPTGS
jgi:hypothetical protein